ncbi:MAG: hypothetical protein KC643_24215 [Nitrospira sp.]|nr:hypothetical protein [Nitrospira sp.]
MKDGNQILPEGELNDSLEILDEIGYLKLGRTMGGISYFQVTTEGMEEYLTAYMPNYSEITRDIIALIVNRNIKTNLEIMSEMNVSQRLIDHILELLALNGHIRISKAGGSMHIYSVSPSLKRVLAT